MERAEELATALEGAGAEERDWDGLNQRLQEREKKTGELLDELDRVRQELDRATERLEEERKIAREAGRAEGEEKATAAAEDREAELRAAHSQEVRLLREQADRQREAAVEEARAQEHARIEAFLDEMAELKTALAAKERKRAEGETELMREAGLRKLRLRMEREKEQALEKQERSLRREYDASLVKAMASAEKEFRKRLEQIREEESRRHREALEALRAALAEEGPEAGEAVRPDEPRDRRSCEEALAELREMMEAERERIVRHEVDRALREERGRSREALRAAGETVCAGERTRCDRALADLRAELEAERRQLVEREVARALREAGSGGKLPERAAAGEVERAAEPAPVGPGEMACREAIRKALERARAQWQAETALYVERAVEKARQRWEAGE
jgi:hypothetical protein